MPKIERPDKLLLNSFLLLAAIRFRDNHSAGVSLNEFVPSTRLNLGLPGMIVR